MFLWPMNCPWINKDYLSIYLSIYLSRQIINDIFQSLINRSSVSNSFIVLNNFVCRCFKLVLSCKKKKLGPLTSLHITCNLSEPFYYSTLI